MVAEPEITVPVSVDDAFRVIADGWLYPLWVVGASHMRDVDDDWPQVGARIHHSIGLWPVTLHDDTEVIVSDPPHRVELKAGLGPAGAAKIRLTLTEQGPEETVIRMAERADHGPIALLPGRVQDMMLTPRNRESLRRLRDLISGREGG